MSRRSTAILLLPSPGFPQHHTRHRGSPDTMESRNKLDHRIQTLQKGSIEGQSKVGASKGYDNPAYLSSDQSAVTSPMLYRVRAKPIDTALSELYRLLVDGTIANQEPDGEEIVASMRRATLKKGLVEWNETCYCNPPLRHERATVYDRFFTDMKIRPVEVASDKNETSFWTYLESESPQTTVSEESTISGSMTRALGRNTV